MTPINTADLRALLEKATPGPWVSGVYFVDAAVNDGTHKNWTPPSWVKFGRCAYCARKPEQCSNVRPASDTDGTRHVNREDATTSPLQGEDWVEESNWHAIASEATHEAITGNYGEDVGGVCSSPADSALIVALRNAAPSLLDELDQARARIAELERQRDELRPDAKKYRAGIQRAAWVRGDGCDYVAIPVARGSDLSCPAMRDLAVDRAVLGESPRKQGADL